MCIRDRLEEAGAKVVVGLPNQKVHAKLCMIRKRIDNVTTHYGFVSTGNLNEKTALVYGDQCMLTSDRKIMADVNRIFTYLEHPKTRIDILNSCKTLLVCPTSMRRQLVGYINREIKNARHGKEASIIVKLNSLSDEELILKLEDAARAGVEIKMIIRGIYCMYTENKKFIKPIQAISIVDEYLEHARVIIFGNGGNKTCLLYTSRCV